MRKLIVNARAALAAAAVALLAQGCGPFWVNPWITVQESQLNWVEIHYYNTDRDPPKRIAVYINGAGHVELRKGTSDRVSNDFSKSIAGIDWKDYRTQRKMADPKHVQDIFQDLVNAGVLDRDKWGNQETSKDTRQHLLFHANIIHHHPRTVYPRIIIKWMSSSKVSQETSRRTLKRHKPYQ